MQLFFRRSPSSRVLLFGFALVLLLLVVLPAVGLAVEIAGLAEQIDPTAPVQVPPATEEAMSYYRTGNALWGVKFAWSVAVALGLLFSGFSARMRDLATRIGRRWFFVIAVYAVFFSIVNYLLDLPLSYYSGFVRQHAYDLSNQGFGKWMGDSLKGLMIGLIGNVLLLWLPYGLLRISPKRWWLYTGLGIVPLIFVMLLIQPIYIAPLFNDFGAMQNKELETKILELADRAGIEGGRVFEVNKSIDTNAVNAYVNGFMGTKRIVLWDTLIEKLDEDELLFVMAHEMGHYVLGHVIRGVLFGSLLTILLLYLVHRSAGAALRRWGDRWGVHEFSDIASLPLLLLLFFFANFIMSPGMLAFSRYQEHEADRFGLELVQNSRAAGTGFVKLQQQNLGNPRPGWIYRTWRASHPPLGERVDFANEYHPWRDGEPLRYGDLFRD